MVLSFAHASVDQLLQCWRKRRAYEILVIPAKAGIHLAHLFATTLWIPAFAGMTDLTVIHFISGVCVSTPPFMLTHPRREPHPACLLA